MWYRREQLYKYSEEAAAAANIIGDVFSWILFRDSRRHSTPLLLFLFFLFLSLSP
jgi:hypothetical protein